MPTVRLEGLGKWKQFSDLIGNQTHDLPACSIVPQPIMLLQARFLCDVAFFYYVARNLKFSLLNTAPIEKKRLHFVVD
jgi:hypothetical protein